MLMIAAFHMTADVLACPKTVSRQGPEEAMVRVRPVSGLNNSPVVVRQMGDDDCGCLSAALQMTGELESFLHSRKCGGPDEAFSVVFWLER